MYKKAPDYSSAFFVLLSLKDLCDCICAALFGCLVEVRINVCRCRDVRMTEEVGYFDERFVVVDQEAREGMPQVVKSDVLQTMPFEEPIKVVCYIAWSKEVAKLVHADVILICQVV